MFQRPSGLPAHPGLAPEAAGDAAREGAGWWAFWSSPADLEH